MERIPWNEAEVVMDVRVPVKSYEFVERLSFFLGFDPRKFLGVEGIMEDYYTRHSQDAQKEEGKHNLYVLPDDIRERVAGTS
jgi:hypothetical protein